MRTTARVFALCCLPFCFSASFFLPRPAWADDEAKSQPDRKSPAGSTDAAAKTANTGWSPGLTERERMLLDRVEQLERRVAELEAAHASATTTAPSSVNASAPAAAPGPSNLTPIGAPSLMTNSTPAVLAPTAAGSGTASASEANATGPAATAVSPLSTPAVATQAADKPKKAEPFTFADFTWLNGNPRTKTVPMDTPFFTPEIRADVDYIYDFNHPKDDTISGSSEVFRANEVQLTQLGVGGDFHFDNVRARVMTQFGMYSQTTPRNDASYSRGQWNLDGAYRYLSEAYGGYHFNALHGINVDAGIFMSYVGLFSYYNFDNWTYQPSYVSSNTPWFFNGVRVQIFPTEKLKIEPWFINGWQSYGRFNNRPGFGFQILWRPTGWLSVLGNQYMLGADTLGQPGRIRYHSDNSIQIKYYDNPENFVSKAAFSLTGDIGCEHGGGVSCYTNTAKGPKQDFLGFMLYNRLWFNNDKYGLTIGGGRINNPGRYLVLIPPINGATASSGTPYFTANPGDPFKAWDASATLDWMPSQYITWRWEYNYRGASVPYFSGSGGVTPPASLCPTPVIGNNICGSPGALVPGFTPDLRKVENRLNMAILVKF